MEKSTDCKCSLITTNEVKGDLIKDDHIQVE